MIGIIIKRIVRSVIFNGENKVLLVLIILIKFFVKWLGVVIVRGIDLVSLLCYIIKFE